MDTQKVIKYPKLSYSRELYPNERVVLGKKWFWTEKRDGSNVRCFLDKNENIQFGSRNIIPLSSELLTSIRNTNYISTLRDCLKNHKTQWHSNLIIFFELLQKGSSPTKTETHNKDNISIFDIYSLEEGWLSYIKIHQICYAWNLPVVELWGVSSHSNLKTFRKFKNNILKLAQKKGREGTVAKYYHGFHSIYFKERLDVPQLDKVKTHKDKTSIEYPPLPDAEVMNEVQKVLDELGMEKFRDKRIAMPLIAQYVSSEAKQRLCSNPKNIYLYYLDKLKN